MKPSVVFFNRVYPPGRGATGRVLRDLARSFARDGWDVTVVACGPQPARERDGAIRVLRVRGSAHPRSLLAYNLIWLRMLLTGLFMPRPDLIVTMTDPPMLVVAGRIMARFRKCRHMNWCQDLYPDLLPALGIRLPPPFMQFLRGLSRRSMKKCDRVVVIGRCMARHLTHSGMDPQRITLIPNWPDIELMPGGGLGFWGAAANKRGSRKSVALNAAPPPAPAVNMDGVKPYESLFRDTGDKFRILYSGNLGRAHPLQTILDAATLLAGTNPEIEFVFVGDGPQFDRLAKERSKRGIENIRFLPYQPSSRLRELMESGDLHLISMTDRAAGLLVPCKLYSALAVGRPCILIGPPQSETARVISDFHAGTVVPQGQAQRLAEIIRAYRFDGELWNAAHEGAARAGKVFVPEELMKAWLERARTVAQVDFKFKPKRAGGRQ